MSDYPKPYFSPKAKPEEQLEQRGQPPRLALAHSDEKPHDREHVTDGSPCWCGTASVSPGSTVFHRPAATPQEMGAATELLASELAVLAKVREAFKAYQMVDPELQCQMEHAEAAAKLIDALYLALRSIPGEKP